jgi:hypothetical protein
MRARHSPKHRRPACDCDDEGDSKIAIFAFYDTLFDLPEVGDLCARKELFAVYFLQITAYFLQITAKTAAALLRPGEAADRVGMQSRWSGLGREGCALGSAGQEIAQIGGDLSEPEESSEEAHRCRSSEPLASAGAWRHSRC